MHRNRPNPETAFILADLLERWQEVSPILVAYLERYGSASSDRLARRLRVSCWQWARQLPGHALLRRLVRQGLRRVDWQAVAGRLVERACRQQPRAEREALEQLLRERGWGVIR